MDRKLIEVIVGFFLKKKKHMYLDPVNGKEHAGMQAAADYRMQKRYHTADYRRRDITHTSNSEGTRLTTRTSLDITLSSV